MSFDYQRNENGQITAENSTRYTYDDLNRLTSWYDPATEATTTYTYDADYNLTGATRNGAALKRFTFDAAERISNVGYAYDVNGNLTSDGARTYAYDALNRLTSVTGADGATIARYTYDAANRRTSSTGANGATTYFHYDGASSNVIAETDGEGHTIATYAWAGGSPVAMTRGGQTFYYHTNAHGDVLALTNADGDVVASYTYDPWGNPTSATGTVENPYRYAGYRFDSATGLYYLLNRYYSPSQSRFITRDLLAGDTKAPATMNHYAYCVGDPVNHVDLSGLCPQGFSGWLDQLQLALDVVGLIPGWGEIADGVNALLSVCRGDMVNAGFSAGAMIPGVGMGSTFAKWGNKGLKWGGKAAKGVRAARVLSSVDDVFANPSILKGMTPGEVAAKIGNTPGWQVEALGRGAHKGEGWILREYTPGGNMTGRMIQWHPGGGHHGPVPYWKVSSGSGGTVRIQ